MRRSTLTAWFAAALLLCATALGGACGSDGSGRGGSGGSEGGGPPGTGGEPPELVVCDNLGSSIPEDGDLCNQLGYTCDVPCGNCYFVCEADLTWHEYCWECPANRPKAGDACDPCAHTGDCSYPPEAACGPGSETVMICDQATATWQDAAVLPCVVECDYWSDIYPEEGDACADPGDICDNPGSGCAHVCGEDHLWHYQCWTCPVDRPTDGDPCDPATDNIGCGYPPVTTCGPGSGTSFDCYDSTWHEVDAQPCP